MKLPALKNIKSYFTQHPLLLEFIQWTKDHSFAGFNEVPIYDVVIFITNELKRDNIVTRANSMAFSFFLSLFPTMIVLFTLIPYILPYFYDTILSYLPGQSLDFQVALQEQLKEVLPDNVEDRLIHFINDITMRPRVGLLSFGFFLAVFFSSNGMMTLMRGFEKSYPTTFVKRKGLHKRLISIQMTFFIGIMVITSVLLIVSGNSILSWLLNYIDANDFIAITIYVLRWIIIISLFYSAISLLYRYGPAARKRFPFFNAGTTLATILSLLSSLIFSFFVNEYGAHNKLYGPIGTIIVIMLWIQINAFVILIGFELNASIAVNRDLKKEIHDE
ncbi:MAG: YihY/virulence factor BrkB family protein [Saprospiraceae bacterium]